MSNAADTRDLEALISDGLDTESLNLEPAVALFSAPVLSLGELETLIAEALDREFGC
jgi:hypothetical protein